MARFFRSRRVFDFNLAPANRAGQPPRPLGFRGRIHIIRVLNIRLSIHGKIRQPIGQGVVMAKVVDEIHGIKIADEGLSLIVESLERRIFDAVFAEHLFDDKFTVAANLKFASAEFGGFAEADDEGHVFGHVVSGFANIFADGDEGRGVFGGENDADAGEAGISAAAAVEAEGDGFFHCCHSRGAGKSNATAKADSAKEDEDI